jgi:hypothetical protein
VIARHALGFVVVAAALTGPLAGQAAQDQTGRISTLFIIKPKPGMGSKLEEGMKKHLAYHTRVNDTRTITVSNVVLGDDLGTYRVVYNNMRWQDLDAAQPLVAGDQADLALNVFPYVESTVSRVLLRSDSLSRIPVGEPAKAMSAVNYVFLNPGKGPEYAAYLGRLKQAHDRANSSYRYWVASQIVGADGPVFVLVRPIEKFADNTPAQNRQVLVAAFGELEADRLLNVPDEAVRRTASFITVNRTDLGYTPARRP